LASTSPFVIRHLRDTWLPAPDTQLPHFFRKKSTSEYLRKAGMWFVNGKAWESGRQGVGWIDGWEGKALQECNLSAQSFVGCECIDDPGAECAGIFLFRDASQTTA
jgi:hypothetical protein